MPLRVLPKKTSAPLCSQNFGARKTTNALALVVGIIQNSTLKTASELLSGGSSSGSRLQLNEGAHSARLRKDLSFFGV